MTDGWRAPTYEVKPSVHRLRTISHNSNPVYEDGEIIGRDLHSGGNYRYIRRPDGEITLELRLSATGPIETFGPYKNKTAAGRTASDRVLKFWEEKMGRGVRPKGVIL